MIYNQERDTKPLLITETFTSIQGEGRYIGIPMMFIRTNRCNLRCTWCDSTYTFQGGEEIPLKDLIETVRNYPNQWVCFTGGEPLLQREALEFVDALGSMGKKILLETGGSLPIMKMAERDWVFIDMDVKTPSSGEQNTLHMENLKFLRDQDYIKFVIKDETDLQYAFDFIDRYRPSVETLFQPAWGTSVTWLSEEVLRSNRNIRVLLQLHKIIWGERRGV